MEILLYVIIVYLIITNIIGFVMMGVDKNRAKNNKWRIQEKTLFLIAAIGGSVGSLLGMRFFRHKTKHMSFVLGMPFLLIIQIILIVFIIKL